MPARIAAASALLVSLCSPLALQADPGAAAPAIPESSTGQDEADDSSPAKVDDDDRHSRFVFGSYGRARADFQHKLDNVVSHGPRLFEPSYAELDFQYELDAPNTPVQVRVLATLALFEPLAHFDASFGEARSGVRNLYARVSGFVPGAEGLAAWAGSRMLRGDDVYLLDWWPLDNLNTLGGGLSFDHEGLQARLHAGVNRLDDDFQVQQVAIDRSGYGTGDLVLLDRQRTLGSLRLQHIWDDLPAGLGAKAVAYGELQHIPAGQRIPPQLIEAGDAPLGTLETLPAERGWVGGAQLGLFERGTTNHVNLFFRWASGLAAYGEFGVPFGVADDRSAHGAHDLSGAFSANWESRWVGLMAAGYLRRFTDADDQSLDTDDFVEGALALRPIVFLTDHIHQGLEFSYQRTYPFGLDPESGQTFEPAIFQASAMQIISLDRGSFARPQLRLRYTASFANDDARDRYRADDARRPAPVEHVVSLGAEWWFNSSTY